MAAQPGPGMTLVLLLLLVASCLVPTCAAGPATTPAVQVSFIGDEADAVLSILTKRQAGETIVEADWQRLFSSEGYVRLKKRELGMGRALDDAEFRAFVHSDSLVARAAALEETLRQYRRVDVAAAAREAMVYLPKDARIRARIYPVIKPKENSFVFDVPSDPAIFLYLNPDESKEKFENTMVHELHHIGYGSSCPPKRVADEIARLPENERSALEWLGAFGEGFAMLAAAGGPDLHPHARSGAAERARWDADVANFNRDLKRLEAFFLDVLEKRLIGAEAIQEAGFAFFGEQGPWYTVGWKMAVVIEKDQGRARMIRLFCDERDLLTAYNQAAARYDRKAKKPLASWSPFLATALSTGATRGSRP